MSVTSWIIYTLYSSNEISNGQAASNWVNRWQFFFFDSRAARSVAKLIVGGKLAGT